MVHERDPDARLPLRFRHEAELDHVDGDLRSDISALAACGRTLFAACDDTSTVERLVLHESGGYFDDHRSLALGDWFDLPAGPDCEADIEALAIDGGFLWICGSHSLKRPKVDKVGDLRELLCLSADPNRHFLGRLRVHEEAPGVWTAARDGAARLLRPRDVADEHGVLHGLMARDPVLSPFLHLPCKEGGFDVEGLAVRGDRVWLGLRGPVIGKYAVIVALRLEEHDGELEAAVLEGGERYALHFVDLDGFGIRDLLIDGDDLLILVGPMTDIDGLTAVYRYPGAMRQRLPAVVPREATIREIELPVTMDQDHPEGIALVDLPAGRHLLVGYDSPGQHRLVGRRQLLADAFRMGR